MDSPVLVAADAVVTMDAALPHVLRGAGVVVQGGRIAAVGELPELRRRFGNLPEQPARLRGVLVPGFVNAHTHLELSYQSAAGISAEHFTQWVSALMGGYPPPEQIEGVVRAATRRGAVESLKAGVTTLGDITRHAAITRSELAAMNAEPQFPRAPRVISFGEVMGLGKLRARAQGMIDAAISPLPPSPPPLLRPAISPHAPYTVEGPTLRACVRAAITRSSPVAMHLAENIGEIEFLSDLAGPFGHEWDVMQRLDILDDQVPRMPGGPIRWAQRWGLLLADATDPRPRRFPVLLAHVNYCDKGEMAQLAVSRASVAYCPRTHAYFRHPPHRYREMLENGINVCLGTDSLASNPDLSVLREAQLLVRRDGFDPHEALALITRRGAEALGIGAEIGTLAPGKWADMVLLPCADAENPLAEIMQAAPMPETAWMAGVRVSS